MVNIVSSLASTVEKKEATPSPAWLCQDR